MSDFVRNYDASQGGCTMRYEKRASTHQISVVDVLAVLYVNTDMGKEVGRSTVLSRALSRRIWSSDKLTQLWTGSLPCGQTSKVCCVKSRFHLHLLFLVTHYFADVWSFVGQMNLIIQKFDTEGDGVIRAAQQNTYDTAM